MEINETELYNGNVISWFRKIKALNPAISPLEGSWVEMYNGSLKSEAKRILGLGTMNVVLTLNGKIANSTVANPHVSKYSKTTSLQAPTGFTTEINQSEYGKILSLDGQLTSISTSTAATMGQELFSFDILSVFNRSGFGVPVANLNTFLTNIQINWQGFGIANAVNKATISLWSSGAWKIPISHTAAVVTKLTRDWGNVSSLIQSDGFVHAAVNSEAYSTAASTINTDYVECVCTIDLTKI